MSEQENRLTWEPTLFDALRGPAGRDTPASVGPFTEGRLAALAVGLGARAVRGWSAAEEALAGDLPPVFPRQIEATRRLVLAGHDPLGRLFSRLRSAAVRRSSGATYTPQPIIDAMFGWVVAQGVPARVVDPGTGSGRYLLKAARCFPTATLIGIELDPLAALMARANLATCGHAHRAEIVVGDFRQVRLPAIGGRTLYVGNPPYVRHHLLEPRWKEWLVRESAARGLAASQLAGLHVYFFLATALRAAPHDFGAFITAAEWLDVNYGSLVRDLFLGPLGGKRIVVVEPTAAPFPDADTTAAIIYFEVGSRSEAIRLKRVDDVAGLLAPNGHRVVRRERLETERRWSHLTRAARDVPAGYIELGELCRVHRGQVTGSNKVWIAGPHSAELPASVLLPTVTKARELIRAGKALSDVSTLRCVVDLPVDLDSFDPEQRGSIERFLTYAERHGARENYTAVNRRAWWAVGLRQPAPILATYMARRAPAFVRNNAAARHINIAHGLYPREPLGAPLLDRLASYLATAVSQHDGRTYAGGLTKFEPREMERLPIPEPTVLMQMGVA